MKIGQMSIQIDKDIPIPTARRRNTPEYGKLLRKMKVGKHSIYLENIREANKMRNRFYKLGALCAVRRDREGYRLWITKKEKQIKTSYTPVIQSQGTKVKKVIEKVIDDSHVSNFFIENVVGEEGTKTSTITLYRAFKKYCERNELPYLIIPDFKLAIKRRLGYKESHDYATHTFYFKDLALKYKSKNGDIV